jgi:MOSC domain-containing protein YiiM
MSNDSRAVDSDSVGDPARFRTLDYLESALAKLSAPSTTGRVALLVRRVEMGTREFPERVVMQPATGLPGDSWGRQTEPSAEAQLAVMQIDVAELIANGQPLALFGDNMFVELDLSTGNLPVGSRLRVGAALMEVTPMPHNGCRKFNARFGPDALKFVSKADLRHRNLRGIYLRVVEPGEVAVGDSVEVVSRAELPDARVVEGVTD